MIKVSKLIGKILAGILLIPFIVITVASMVFLTVERQTFNPDFYKRALEREEIYDQLPRIFASQINHSMQRDPCIVDPGSCEEGEQSTTGIGGPSYFQALTEEDWTLLVSGLLPPDWLADQVETSIDDLLDVQATGTGELSMTISLLELKDRLSGEAGVRAILELLQNKPTCTNEDILAMTRVLEGRESPGENFLSCQPSEAFIEGHTAQMEVILRRSLSDVPDEIDLSEGMFTDGESSAGELESLSVFGHQLPPYLSLMWARWAMRMSPLAAFSVLLVIALLAVHSFKGLGSWWGIPLALSGLIALLPTLLVGRFVAILKDFALTDLGTTAISPLVTETATGLVLELIRLLLSQLRSMALIVTSLGAVLILGGVFLKKPRSVGAIETQDEGESTPSEGSTGSENMEDESQPGVDGD